MKVKELAFSEDLDCSGLPFTDKVVCQYDEGFIVGVLEAYTGKPFLACPQCAKKLYPDLEDDL